MTRATGRCFSGDRVAALQSVLSQFFHQRGAPHAQPLGGMRHNATGFLKRLADIVHFQAAEMLLEVEPPLRQPRVKIVRCHGRPDQDIAQQFGIDFLIQLEFFRQVLGLNNAVGMQYGEAFNQIGQFANVAGPVVLAQGIDSAG